MKQYKIKAYFKKGTLQCPTINLVAQDFNSTELLFEFDVEEGRKVFEMKREDEKVYITDIVDNKISLVDYDKEGNEISLIPMAGTYTFEIVNYTEDSKLTVQQIGTIKVRDEKVSVDDELVEADSNLPILDNLIIETEARKKELEEITGTAKEELDKVIDANEEASKIVSEFEEDVKQYTSDFNTNATNKTTEFNKNAETKTNEFNSNATSKTEEYNTNAEAKVNEFNANVDDLMQDVEDCYNNVLTNEVEGTSIHVEDSANARVLVLENEGNCKQETTTGANLLDLSGFSTINRSGIDFSYSNGKLLVNGTATAQIDVYILNTTWNTKADEVKNRLNSNSGKYRLSSSNSKIENYWNTTNGYVMNVAEVTNENQINTAFLRIPSGTVFKNELLEVQIRSGETIEPWEPYTGSQPSPNPDYPQEVEVIEAYNVLPNNAVSQTIDGITFTVNEDKSITASGTATADINFYINGYDWSPLPAGSYLLSSGFYSSNSTYFLYVDVQEGTQYNLSTVDKNGAIRNIDVDFHYRPRIVIRSGQTLNDVIFKPMLIKGTEVKPYAPYGCIRNKIVRKNLFNKELIKFYANNFSSFENTSNVNNVRIRTSSFNLKDIGLKHNVFYEISGFPNGWILAGIRTYIGTIYLEDTSTYSLIGNKFSILSDKVDHIHLLFKNDNSTEMAVSDFENSNIQLEEGVATDYEPYQEEFLDIKMEMDNLFDKNNPNILNGAIDTGNGNINSSTNGKTLYVKIPSTTNDITVSRIAGKRFAVGTTDTIPSIGTTCLNYIGNNESDSITIPVLTTSKYLVVFYYNSTADTLTEQEILNSIKIYEGREISNTLCGIGDVKDSLRVENGRAILTKRIGKVVLDGTQTPVLSTAGLENVTRFYFQKIISSIKNSRCVSDYFKWSQTQSTNNSFNSIDEPAIHIRDNGTEIGIKINKTIVTTIDELNVWLSENPVTVYYILAEPYEVDLGPVKMPKMFEDVTNISLISTIESNMKLKYVRSTNIVVNNLAKAIIALGGEINV